MINIDFETRSEVDLIVQPKLDNLAGLYNYAYDVEVTSGPVIDGPDFDEVVH